MVLSNKKLKQKLREALSQALISSASDVSCSANPESFRQLLGEATQKPILSKREKRRKALPPEESAIAVKNKSNDDAKVKRKENPKLDLPGGGTEETGDDKTKKKSAKKKKRGADGEEVEGDGKTEEKSKKKMSNGTEETGDDKTKKKRKRGTDGEEVEGEGKTEEKSKKKMSDETRKKLKAKKKKLKAKKKKKAEKRSAKEKDQLGKVAEVVTEANGQQQQEEDNGNSQASVIVPNKVYVGGIPYYSTQDDITSFFEHCGTISDMECMTFPDTGKFRGIAILTFKTEEAAKRALAMDGADMGGFFLKIELYKSTRSATKLPEFCPPVIQGYYRIYVGNLSWDITEDHLKKLFSGCSVSSIRFGEDKVTGDFKGYGHVDFSDEVSVEKALKLDQSILLGRPVRISRAVAQRNVGSIGGGSGSGGGVNIGSEPKVEATYGTENVEEQHATTNSNVPASESTVVAAPVVAAPVVAAGKIKRRTCYECGERGHISSACPKKQASEQPIESAG